MVQSLNTKAIYTLASVLRRPSLAVPHVSVANVSEVDYVALKEHAGVKACIFDKDNTLTAPYASSVHPDASSGLRSALEVFGADGVAILSNSAGTTSDDPGFVDAKNIEASLGVAVIRHTEKKPGGLKEVLDHFEVEDPSELCMIGDRLLTDVVFGNLHGMLTVHTLPVCRGPDNTSDNLPAKLVRRVENAVLYSNWFGGRFLKRRRPSHQHWRPEQSPLTKTKNS